MSGFESARDLPDGTILKADVCIIGSGAGGAITAAILARAGLEVVVLEEGGHYTKADFHMREDEAFPMLYQEAGGRVTKDVGITILQGRAVGGTTVVNWTTCFRTPERVLDLWQRQHGVQGFTTQTLGPHWQAVEERLSIRKWQIDEANRNNRLLWDGCKALGLQVDTLHRNVKNNCFRSGYCGMGCPVDAKQSMLVSYLPDAVARGARVFANCRVDRLEMQGAHAARAQCTVIGPDGYNASGAHITVEARRFVLSAGGIGTPAILIRSGLGGGAVGQKTWLHPTVGAKAKYKEPVESFYGAPQTVASHAFAERGDKMGIVMEAVPLHPIFASTTMEAFGSEHRRRMMELAYIGCTAALVADGVDPSEPGGTVTVRASGAPLLDYPLTPRVWEGLREAYKQLGRIALAAGAESFTTGHDPPIEVRSEAELARIEAAPYDVAKAAVFSAHVMGGAHMGENRETSVVRCEDLRHHGIENLHILDGSVLPTGLGVNPQLTIYGISHLVADRLASRWKS